MICKIIKRYNVQAGVRDQYKVIIAPGVDAALMIAIGICFDEYRHDWN